MRKYLLLILLICLVAFKTQAGMIPWLVGSGGGSDPCSCDTETYTLCYTSLHASGVSYACFNNGGSNKEASSNTVDVCDGTTIEYDAINEHILWDISGTTEFNADLCTIFLSVMFTDQNSNGDPDTTCVFESVEGSGVSNRMYCIINDSDDKIIVYSYNDYGGAGGIESIKADSGVTFNVKYRIGYSRQAGEAGNDHAISCVVKGNATDWAVEEDDDIVAWSTAADDFTLGENLSQQSVVDNVIIYPNESVVILGTYKATDPNP